MSTLKHLFSTFKVKKMELANRVVMPPMGTNLGNSDATVSEALLAYMKRQTKGGAGLIITEITAVHPSGIVWESQLGAAGPAGLTAAYETKRLGHKVSLFEKKERGGGQLHFAGQAPFKRIYGEWIFWLICQVERIGVRIQTNTCVTDTMIDEGEPEVVILATGGEKTSRPFRGLICRWFVTHGRYSAKRSRPKKTWLWLGAE